MRSEAWRPAAAACNRLPREARDPARQALRPGCEELAARSRRQLPAVVGRRAPKETEARPRGPKSPRWSAERRASRVMGRKAPRKRLACRVMCTPNGCRCTRTTLGAPPTLIRGERSKVANLGRGKRAAGRRKAVCMESSAVRAGRPHPEERACRKSSANSNARARVSKDEERAIGFALMLRDASQRIWAVEAPALLSMRAGATHHPAAVQNERRLSFIVCGLLFTMTFATRTCRPH